MRIVFAIVGFVMVVSAKSQSFVWQQNKSFVDSLITMYRTKSKCSLTGSDLKHEKRKRHLDLRLLHFLNKFYFGELSPSQVETILHTKFRRRSWMFDETRQVDSLQIYKGRIRSSGNLEPFITYVILNNEIVGTHISIKIRSKLDCVQPNDGEIPDLLYLSDLIQNRINFPFEEDGWTEYFHSKIWTRKDLPIYIESRVRYYIDGDSATPLNRKL